MNIGGYRPNVAIMLFNEEKKIFMAKRIGANDTIQHHQYQTAQGGVEDGETEEQAIIREVFEELGLQNLEFIAKSEYYYYDFPESFNKPKRGQKQLWFLAPFSKNRENEINFNTTGHPEFNDYKWVDKDSFAAEIIYFKKDVYEKALKEFWPIIEKYKF
ncbi:MAG: RNA pyrophosphohydrolase [Rickettsiales bacterium]|jgi:putative (di)nucleoside polyphosphate hydrolase|nr:RNA pyrophosphohydrolase [Rickettsiales bacterium]